MPSSLANHHQGFAERDGAEAVLEDPGQYDDNKRQDGHQQAAGAGDSYQRQNVKRNGQHCSSDEQENMRYAHWERFWCVGERILAIVGIVLFFVPWIFLAIGPFVLSWFHISIHLPLPLWVRILIRSC